MPFMTTCVALGNQMIINGSWLWDRTDVPIKNMLQTKVKDHGVSHGLSEAGYDIRIKQDIFFYPQDTSAGFDTDIVNLKWMENDFLLGTSTKGRFSLASAIEEFDMPNDLVGVVHDKSTWARQGVSVFNTIIEPGWKGFLTLEIVFHGNIPLHIPAGSGIAQVIFHKLICPTKYDGKYQNQEDRPVSSIWEKPNV
jgi:dCTP deaminase